MFQFLLLLQTLFVVQDFTWHELFSFVKDYFSGMRAFVSIEQVCYDNIAKSNVYWHTLCEQKVISLKWMIMLGNFIKILTSRNFCLHEKFSSYLTFENSLYSSSHALGCYMKWFWLTYLVIHLLPICNRQAGFDANDLYLISNYTYCISSNKRSGAYLISKFWGAVLIRQRQLKEVKS